VKFDHLWASSLIAENGEDYDFTRAPLHDGVISRRLEKLLLKVKDEEDEGLEEEDSLESDENEDDDDDCGITYD
jgi:hypothetical protein